MGNNLKAIRTDNLAFNRRGEVGLQMELNWRESVELSQSSGDTSLQEAFV